MISHQARRRECIMAVDDELVNLKLLDKMLRPQGYEHLVLVEDSRRVVSLYRDMQPDLILLDLNMPHLDGYEVMAQLQALGDPLLPPIVILTALQGKEHLFKALGAGARDYLTKPFDRTELLMRVRNLLDVHGAHRLLTDQAHTLDALVRTQTEELRRTRLEVIRRLGMAAEYRDEETGNHILRMSHVCALLARALDWSEAECELMLNASPMHDIGKIGIPDAILLKPGKLDADEWAVMKTHPSKGARLLEGDDSELMRMARDIALTHHEKWDGSGYPNGLAGPAIPLAGRIAALADVFDALTAQRPYKKAWTLEAAVEWIVQQRGQHFDPAVVDVFMEQWPQILEIWQRYADSTNH
jgi:putative two-component system response regulator